MSLFRKYLLILVLVTGCVSISGAAEKRVLGKLGQAMYGVGIHSSTSTRSHVFYHVQPYAYLVVGSAPKTGWTSVLMQNGMKGFVPTDAVTQLPYLVTQEAPRYTQSPSRSGGAAARSGLGVANYSLNFIGTPYKWGGTDERNGIDCSGFVKKMFGAIGVGLPRTAAEQANVGLPITRYEDLQPGDRLYFYEAKRNKIGHTGIYIGNGYFVHASSGKHGVNTSYLSSGWQKLLVEARR